MESNNQTHEEWIREMIVESRQYAYLTEGPDIDETALYTFDNQPVYWNTRIPSMPVLYDSTGRKVEIPDDRLMRLADGECVWFNQRGQLVTCNGHFNINLVPDNAVIEMNGLFFTPKTVPPCPDAQYTGPYRPFDDSVKEIDEDTENQDPRSESS